MTSPPTLRSSRPEKIGRLQVDMPHDELVAIDDFRYSHRVPSRAAAVRELIRRGLASQRERKNREIKYLKNFYHIRFGPLEKNWPFPKSLAAGSQKVPVRASADVRRTAHSHVAQRRMWL